MLFLTALSTGLKLVEILGLKWSDIDFNTGALTFNRTLQRFTEIDRNGNRESKVIEQMPKTKNSIRTIPTSKNILFKLGIEPLKFHGLRHTYATRLFEANISPKTVPVLMGHYDISITADI